MTCCKIDGCDGPQIAKGLCRKHYLRQYRHGSTTAKQGGTQEERFWRSVTRGADDECWLWQGQKSPAGYGLVSTPDGGRRGAHRISYLLHHGAVGNRTLICHRCDTPQCVNPAHLFAGTPQDNMDDMAAKGRRRTGAVRGVRSALAKLNDDAVRFIRANPQIPNTELAKRFGVSTNTVRFVRIGKRWRHVT